MKFNVGDKVRFLNKEEHIEHPWCYPEVGTVGVVLNAEEANKEILVDWGKDSGCDNNDYYYDKCAWWCLKTLVEKVVDYTNDEVWDMLKPKMKQFALPYSDVDNLSQEIKNMIVAAYRSGYGRATKGRDFMIERKEEKKPSITKAIDAVLGGKTLVTFYDSDDSYAVSNFEYSAEGKQGIEIHDKPIYDSGECGLFSGYDVIGEPDCEIYVAVPLVGYPAQKGDKVINIGNLTNDFGVFLKAYKVFNYAFKHNKDFWFANVILDDGNRSAENTCFWTKDILDKLRVLVPIRDYLKENGVNV